MLDSIALELIINHSLSLISLYQLNISPCFYWSKPIFIGDQFLLSSPTVDFLCQRDQRQAASNFGRQNHRTRTSQPGDCGGSPVWIKTFRYGKTSRSTIAKLIYTSTVTMFYIHTYTELYRLGVLQKKQIISRIIIGQMFGYRNRSSIADSRQR